MNSDFLGDARDYDSLFSGFVGREGQLGTIVRYENYRKWLLFPTDLNSHQHQVAAITKYLIELIGLEDGVDFCAAEAIIMAYIHDDHEPFMAAGDVQSGDRAHLNNEQRKMVERDECKAIGKAVEIYPSEICGYIYADLLWDAAHDVATIGAQLVKLADKLDGLGEALHEIASGNVMMLQGVESLALKKMNVSPIEYYREYFSELDRKLPLLMDKLGGYDFWFLRPIPENDTLSQYYNLWKTAIRKYTPEWERQRLFGQGES